MPEQPLSPVVSVFLGPSKVMVEQLSSITGFGSCLENTYITPLPPKHMLLGQHLVENTFKPAVAESSGRFPRNNIHQYQSFTFPA